MIEYFTALVISYSVQDYKIETTVWFESERHCQTAMDSGSTDGLYNFLYDYYGNDIMAVCHVSEVKSKNVRPKLRPTKEE